MSKFKKFLIFLIIFTLFSGIVSFIFLDKIRVFARENIPPEIKIFVKEKFFGKQYIKELAYYRMSNYNQSVLPNSQFELLSLSQKKINNFENNRTYIEKYDGKLIIVNRNGKMAALSELDLNNQQILKNNLENITEIDIQDTEIVNKKIILAATKIQNKNNQCKSIVIFKSELNQNLKNLNFEKIFESEECAISNNSLKISKVKQNDKLILIATGANYAHGKAPGEERKAQSSKSIYGKIISLNLESKELKILAKGVRFPKSIGEFNNKVLFTDGYNFNGDEINLLVDNGNYGWPIASTGEDDHAKNFLSNKKDYKYLKDHSKEGFVEPVISFLPSILINKLIKVPDDFSIYWKNNFLLSAGSTIYRIKFNDELNKVLFYEKIVLSDNVEDVIFSKKMKAFIFASHGKLLILRKKIE